MKAIEDQYTDALNIAQGQLCIQYQEENGRPLAGPLDMPDMEALYYLMHHVGQSNWWLAEVKSWLGLPYDPPF